MSLSAGVCCCWLVSRKLLRSEEEEEEGEEEKEKIQVKTTIMKRQVALERNRASQRLLVPPGSEKITPGILPRR